MSDWFQKQFPKAYEEILSVCALYDCYLEDEMRKEEQSRDMDAEIGDGMGDWPDAEESDRPAPPSGNAFRSDDYSR